MNPAYSDPELLDKTLQLRARFELETFFETGTYHGLSSKIVSEYFKNVITVESDEGSYKQAVTNLSEVANCTALHGSSPDIMRSRIKEGDNSIFFFLDAHWDEYWPLLDELQVIRDKKIKPVIAIHDFYVPNGRGGASFGFDSYNGQPLDFSYIKTSIERIYEGEFEIEYSTSSTTNSGVIFIYPILPK